MPDDLMPDNLMPSDLCFMLRSVFVAVVVVVAEKATEYIYFISPSLRISARRCGAEQAAWRRLRITQTLGLRDFAQLVVASTPALEIHQSWTWGIRTMQNSVHDRGMERPIVSSTLYCTSFTKAFPVNSISWLAVHGHRGEGGD